MRINWQKHQDKSKERFLSLIPRLKTALGAIDIQSVEGTHSPLDTECGIDYIATTDDGQELGIASRQVEGEWKSFLLKKSEYVRWRNALEVDGALRPHWVINGEWDGDELQALAIVKVRDLVEAIPIMAAHKLPIICKRFKEDGKPYMRIPYALLQAISEVNTWHK